MASYIEGYCPAQMPPPYSFGGVRIWSFPLLADLGAVEDVVRRYLGPVQRGDEAFTLIRGANPDQKGLTIVYMMVLDYAQMRCIGPSSSGPQGYLSQREYLFGVVVKRRLPPGESGGLLEDLAFFCPTIFVDNPTSSVCGNTVLGYPKGLAWFQMPRSGSYPIQIETQVFVDDRPTTGQTWQRLASIRNMASLIPGASLLDNIFPFGDLDKLFGPNGALPLEPDTLDLFRNRHSLLSYDAIQLKQLRNAESPHEASYTALVTCTVELTKVRRFGPLPPAVVDLPTYASLDIPKDLGLKSMGGLYMPVVPYWVDCDFKLGKIVERAVP